MSAPIDAAMRAQDPRLEQRVTITDQGAYLGKLMAELSAQTGVALSVSDRDAASGERVAICLRNVPLIDALNSLWSLFSYKGADWEWSRQSSDDSGKLFSYQFSPSKAVKLWSDTIRGKIQAEYEEQAKGLLDGLKLTPDELAGAQMDPIVKIGLEDQTIHHGMSAFAELSPDVQNRLLHGTDTDEVPVTPSDPNSASFAALHFLIDGYQRVNPSFIGGKIPDRIHFTTDEPEGFVTKCMSVIASSASFGFGDGVLGGDPFENRWQSRLAGFWFHEGDLATNDLEGRIVPSPAPPLTADETRKLEAALRNAPATAATARRVQQVSDADSISFIERMPDAGVRNRGDGTPGPAYEKPLSNFFDRLSNRKYHHKWRGGILLVSRFTWINRDANTLQFPYATLQKIRRLNDDPRPTLEDLLFAAGALTPEQTTALYKDNPGLLKVIPNLPLLTELEKVSSGMLARMRTPEGVPLDDLSAHLVDALKLDRRYDGAVRLRESEKRPADPKDSRVFHYFSFMGLPDADTSGRKPEVRSFVAYQVLPPSPAH